MIKKLSKKTLLAGIILALFLSPYSYVSARSSSDIQKDIDAQKAALNDAQNSLSDAKSQLDNYESALSGSQAGLPQIEAEIDKVKAQINYNNLQKDIMEKSKVLKELEKEEKEESQKESLKSNYMEWRVEQQTSIANIMLSDQIDYKRMEQYASVVVDGQQQMILGLANDLVDLDGQINDYQKSLDDLNKTNSDLETKKQQLEDQIAYYNSQIANSGNNISNIQKNINDLNQSITNLTAEQQQALKSEAELLSRTGTNHGSISGCNTNDDPNYTASTVQICGLGRDTYQGHGVGLSQFGAYGMAANNGWGFQDILKFYYTGVDIVGGYENTNITVNENYGDHTVTKQMNIDDFVAGQAEMAYNWPHEALKAQIVAYRTYVLKYVQSHGQMDVCYSQAYGNGCYISTVSYNENYAPYNQSAVDETKGLVITYGGQLIDAVYSMDNNQGFGTANNDTVWQNFNGDATAVPYLRSVNDSQYAVSTYYTNWGYKSKTYTMADMDNLVGFWAHIDQYVPNNELDSYDWQIRNMMQDVNTNVGSDVANITFGRDPSLRVNKVFIKGSNGNVSTVGGSWFKYMWNVWIYYRGIKNDNGDFDYIYSLTFFMHSVV